MEEERIIWQPIQIHQPYPDFDILLDGDFARDMGRARISQEKRDTMNLLGTEVLKRLKYPGLSPYIFWRESALIDQINLDGGRGTWLEREDGWQIPDYSKPLKYKTHNMDTSSDTLGLLSLFDLWVYYSEELLR